MNAATQWTTIGWMVLCGLSMGTGFDVYRVASHRFRIPRWLLPALDLLFWAAATLGVFSVLLKHNQGEVRMYVFLGLGIGVTGYFGLFSSRVAKAADLVFRWSGAVAGWMWKTFRMLLVSPLIGTVKVLAKLLDIVFVLTAALLLGIFRLLSIPLKPLVRWTWAKLLPLRRRLRAWAAPFVRWARRLRDAWRYFFKKT